jgi:ABC-2 type transport system ATP-binding protein
VLDHGKLVAQGTPAELKRLVPGGHISLQFADAAVFARAAQILAPTSRDDDALTLQVPGGGDVRSLRLVLDRMDQAGVEVDGLTVHTPDLDDVFLALTGQPDSRPEPRSQALEAISR